MAILQGARITGSVTVTQFIKAASFSGSLTASNLYVRGNVGIGSSSPGAKLDIRQTSAATGLKVFVNDTTTANIAQFIGYDNSLGDTTRMVVQAGGSVGIGTTSPTRKLHIDGGSTTTVGIYLDATGISGTDLEQASDAFRFQIRDNVPALFYTNNTERMRITSDGNVGIGTTTIGNKLTVYTTTQYDGYYLRNANGVVGTMLGVSATNDDGTIGLYSNVVLKTNITANGASYFNGGNVGIGTTSPLHKFQITQAADGNFPTLGTGKGAIFIAGDTNLYGMYLGLNTTTGDGFIQTMRNDSATAYNLILNSAGGNVGIGTTTTGEKITISGNALVFGGTGAVGTGTAYYLGDGANSRDIALTRVGTAALAIGRYYPSAWAETIRFTADGNVGIGTSSPIAMVHVESSNSQGDNKGLIYLKSTSGTNVLKFGVDGTNNFAELRAYTPGVGDNSKLILQPYGGNVGIGTTSPTGTYGKLTVAGGIRTLDDNNSKLELGRYSAGASNSYIKLGTNSNALHFTNAADNADIFTILNGGSVGIGTTAPTGELHIYGSQPAFRIQSSVSGNMQFGQWDTTYNRIQSSGRDFLLISTDATNLIFSTNTSERMRITSDGFVYIGTSSGIYGGTSTNECKLLVVGEPPSTDTDRGLVSFIDSRAYNTSGLRSLITLGTSYTSGGSKTFLGGIAALKENATDGNYAGALALYYRANGAGLSEGLRIKSDGNVGIGTTSPSGKLEVYGATSIFRYDTAGAASLYLRNWTSGGTAQMIFGVASSDDQSTTLSFASNIFSITNYGDPGSSIQFGTRNSSTADIRVTINQDGNVGIGTTTVATKCVVAADATDSDVGQFRVIGSTSNAKLINVGYHTTNNYGFIQALIAGTGYSPLAIQPNGGCVGIGTSTTTSGLQIQTEGTNTTSGSFLFVRSTNASFGGGAIGVGYQYAAAVGNNFTPFRIRAGTTNAIFTVNSAGTIYAGDSTGAIAYGNHDPYFAFNQDTNTGMDWAAADTLTFKTGGTERVRINSSGYVGIGTSSPGSYLQVGGYMQLHSNSTYLGQIGFNRNVLNGTILDGAKPAYQVQNESGTLVFQVYNGSGTAVNSYALVISSSANIGIGTSSPAAKLHVYARGNGAGILIESDPTLDANQAPALKLYPKSPASTERNWAISPFRDTPQGLSISSGNSKGSDPYSDATTRLIIDGISGNVGIGTTTTGEKITISGNALVFGGTGAVGTGTAYYMGDGADSRDIALTRVGTAALAIGRYYPSAWAETIRFTADGNVGIGSSSPGAKLVVTGEVQIQSSAAYYTHLNYNDSGINYITSANTGATYFRGSSNGITAMYVSGDGTVVAQYSTYLATVSGNVGIGTNAPTAKLTVIASNNTGSRIQLGTASTSTFMDANKVNDLLIATVPYNSNPASVSNSGAKWGIKMNGSIDNVNLKSKSACVYAVSEDSLGYNRQVGLALHTSGLDLDNAERVRISNTGNVGIGTTSPVNKLHVSGSSTNLPLKLEGLTTNATGYFLTVDNTTGVVYKSTSGASGTSGTSGANGSPGTSGSSGASGAAGTSGSSGANGGTGSSGSSGTTSIKAWVHFDGTGTSGTSGIAPNASNNVSSITDNGTGDYTINFTSAFANAFYVVSGTVTYDYENPGQSINNTFIAVPRRPTAQAAGSCRIVTFALDNVLYDCKYVRVAFSN
jgi:hypothetical protein